MRSKKANAEWARIGMLGSDGEIVNANEGISDPDRFLARVHSNMLKTGITGHEDQVKEYGKLFGTGTGQTAAMIGGFQQDRLASYERSRKTVADSQGLVDLANQTLSQSSDNLKASFETLEGNVGSILTPLMTSLADAATGAIRGLNSIVSPFGKNGNDPAGNTGRGSAAEMLGAGSAAAGALLGTGWLFRKFPFLGKIAAGGAGWAATQTPAGVALGPTIETGVRGLWSKLPAAAESGLISGLKGGFIGGAVLAVGQYAIDKLVAVLPKPKMTPEKQAGFDAKMRAWDNAWIWQKPGMIWRDIVGDHDGDKMPGGRIAGEETPADGSTRPYGGARARGGPVFRGMSYLVGEKGPEIFTPGHTGGITTNSATNAFLGGSDNSASGQLIASALRFMMFDLTSVLREMMARFVSLNDRRAVDTDGDNGASFYGSGSAAPGGGAEGGGRSFGGGGRRGFMEHGGGAPEAPKQTGRRGLMERHAPGGDAPVDGDSVKIATDFLKRREGFIPNAKWDRNHMRLGFGSDTITGADGKVREVMAGDHVSKEDAERDLARRIPEFQRKIAGQVGVGNWGKLSPQAQGALTSMAYNYGGFVPGKGKADYMKPLRDAIASGDPAKIAAAVRARGGDNGGINNARRAEEADLIAKGGRRETAPNLPPSAPSSGKAAAAFDLAASNLGLRQSTDPAKLQSYMAGGGKKYGVDPRYTAWCAAYVGASLTKAGIKASGSLMANSYRNWGSGVDTNSAKKGDVMMEGRDLHHVGLATGEHRVRGGRDEVEMLSGNYSHMVRKSWMPASNMTTRRAGEAEGVNDRIPAVLQAQAKAQKEERERARKDQTASNDTHHHYHGDIATNVYPQPHHDARRIASLVHKKFDDATRAQLSDGAFA